MTPADCLDDDREYQRLLEADFFARLGWMWNLRASDISAKSPQTDEDRLAFAAASAMSDWCRERANKEKEP